MCILNRCTSMERLVIFFFGAAACCSMSGNGPPPVILEHPENPVSLNFRKRIKTRGRRRGFPASDPYHQRAINCLDLFIYFCTFFTIILPLASVCFMMTRPRCAEVALRPSRVKYSIVRAGAFITFSMPSGVGCNSLAVP